MFIVLDRVYPSHMSEHAASSETGGFFFEFKGKRSLRDTARWVTGVGLSGVGVAIGVIGTASNSYLSMPLGIAITVLGALVLVMFALTRTKRKPVLPEGGTPQVKRISRESAKQSIAAELALLADLYSRGALSPEEFVAAKRRILDT